MKNMWIEIAKEYGVKLNEVFKVEDWCREYKITENGIINGGNGGYISLDCTNEFIMGKCTIIRKPFIPAYDDEYYFVQDDGVVTETSVPNSFYHNDDYYNIEHGNCYRTYDEAEKNIDKHVKQYKEIRQKAGIE